MRVDEIFLLSDARVTEFKGRIRESIAFNGGGGSQWVGSEAVVRRPLPWLRPNFQLRAKPNLSRPAGSTRPKPDSSQLSPLTAKIRESLPRSELLKKCSGCGSSPFVLLQLVLVNGRVTALHNESESNPATFEGQDLT